MQDEKDRPFGKKLLPLITKPQNLFVIIKWAQEMGLDEKCLEQIHERMST